MIWINRTKSLADSAERLSPLEPLPVRHEQVEFFRAALNVARGYIGSVTGNVDQEDIMRRKGYSKIIHAAEQARSQGFQYIWIDTCCIDKSSSAELQEAINSMYRWYRDSEFCIVYLEDITKPHIDGFTSASDIAKAAFQTCRWAKRGWTLQEIIAPVICRFYFQDWTLLGDKLEFLQELSESTGIPSYVLEDHTLVHEVPVAQRMSWAADRQSTRIEDVAYSLLGIFDIYMPLLYGEGERAFIRLQEEILRTTDDYSIFAWSAEDSSAGMSIYRGLLARAPSEFRYCRSIEREKRYINVPHRLYAHWSAHPT